MTNNKLRPLTESSLLTAITVIIGLGIQFPFVALVWTLPLTIITARHDLRYGVLGTLISSAILCLFLTPVTIIPVTVNSAPLALTLGYGFKHNWSAIKIFATSFLASVIGITLFIILTFYMTGINLFIDQIESTRLSMSKISTWLSSMGITSEAMIDSEKQIENALHILSFTLPTMFICYALMVSIINYIAGSYILKRIYKIYVNSLPSFTQWYFPREFVYIYAFALLGRYWGGTYNISLLYQISLNAYLFANIIGLVQGLSVIRFFYKEKNWPAAIWVFIIIMIFVNPVIAQIIAFAGFFDMIFNYRDKFRRNNN